MRVPKRKLFKQRQHRRLPHYYYYDAGQTYLFRTPPDWILCTCPWSHLVAVLEDPITRLIRHYTKAQTSFGLTLSIEDWIEKDLELLDQAGVLLTTRTTTTKLSGRGLPQTDGGGGGAEKEKEKKGDEQETWQSYLRTATDGPVGQGLYYLQLQPWLEQIPKAFPEMQHWSEKLLILKSPSSTATSTSTSTTTITAQSALQQVDRIRDFLKLENRTDTTYTEKKSKGGSSSSSSSSQVPQTPAPPSLLYHSGSPNRKQE